MSQNPIEAIFNKFEFACISFLHFTNSSDNSLLIYRIDVSKMHKIMEAIINQIIHCLLSSRMKRYREHNEKEDFTSKIIENHQNIVFNTIILVAKLHHTINLRILINTYMIN